MGDGASEIRPPPAEIVIDIYRRYAGCRRPTLETRQRRGHRFRLADEGFGAVEGEIVDNVNQQERCAGNGYAHDLFTLTGPGEHM